MKVAISPLNLEVSNKNNIYQKLFSGGKGLRACLTQEVATLLNIPPKQQESLSRIVEYIHQSSLLHDDVIDASPTRRGNLSGWRQYSMKKAVLAGDYLLAESAGEVAHLQNIPLMQLTAHTIKQLVKGEWLQSEIKNQETKEELEKVHELKTASLFQWSLRAPFLLKHYTDKNLNDQLNAIGRLMGLLFQRADDLLDFNIRNKEGKATFKDLEEGILNSFAVHLLENRDSVRNVSHTWHKKIKLNGKGGDQRVALKSCRSLKEVKKCISHKTFEIALTTFDEQSTKYIKICQQKIINLPLPAHTTTLSPTVHNTREKVDTTTLLDRDSVPNHMQNTNKTHSGVDKGRGPVKNTLSCNQAVEPEFSNQSGIKAQLKKWPEKLYWRKNNV